MSESELQRANYFHSEAILGDEIKDFYTGNPTIDTSSQLEVDSVKGQKRGTCTVKSMMYLIKWFLSREAGNLTRVRYDWFKTRLLADRISEVKESLRTDLKFTNYKRLRKRWIIPQTCAKVCTFESSSLLFSPVIRHAVLRKFRLFKHYAQSNPKLVISMKGLLEQIVSKAKDAELQQCYQCLA